MKTALILRHAKAATTHAEEDDFDRKLSERGRGDLVRIGRAIATVSPQRLLVSPAVRARETAQGITAFLKDITIEFDERLYLASADTLHAVLVECARDADNVLIIAHNPGMEEWINDLCGAQVALPTAGLACIDFGVRDYSRINRGSGQLRFYLIPRLLKAIF